MAGAGLATGVFAMAHNLTFPPATSALAWHGYPQPRRLSVGEMLDLYRVCGNTLSLTDADSKARKAARKPAPRRYPLGS